MISKLFIQDQRPRFGRGRSFAVLDQDMQVRYKAEFGKFLEFSIESFDRTLNPLKARSGAVAKGLMRLFSNEVVFTDEQRGPLAWINPKHQPKRKPQRDFDFTLANGVNYRANLSLVNQVHGCHLRNFGFGVPSRSGFPWEIYLNHDLEVSVLDGLICAAVHYWITWSAA